jgi:polyisoprenoid-binding protein YceI
MFRRFVTLTSAALITSIALAAYAGKLKKVAGDEKATCAVDVPGFSFVGKVPTSAVSASDDGESITVKVDVSQLDTGIDMRSKDLQKKLKSKTASLVAKKADLKVPTKDGEKTQGTAKGTLTINNSAQPATFTYTANRMGSHIKVTGKTTVKLKQHGLEFCAPGNVVCVNDSMPVEVSFKLADE